MITLKYSHSKFKLITISLVILMIIFIFSSLIVNKANASSNTWKGYWKNETGIPFVNNVSNSHLNTLVLNAALDNVNNHQDTVTYKRSFNMSGRYVEVKDVNLSSVSWTGKAEGASYNWDGNNHYYNVNIKLNVGKGILNYSNEKLKGLIAHELVHAIGLKHRATKDYLMYPYDSRNQYTPNPVERATIRNHYY